MHPSFSLFPGLRRAAGTLACLALLCTATVSYTHLTLPTICSV